MAHDDRRPGEPDDVAGAIVIDVGDREVVDEEAAGRDRRAERAAGGVAQPVGAARVVGGRALARPRARDGAADAARGVRVAILARLDQAIAAHVALDRVEAGARREGDAGSERDAGALQPPRHGEAAPNTSMMSSFVVRWLLRPGRGGCRASVSDSDSDRSRSGTIDRPADK